MTRKNTLPRSPHEGMGQGENVIAAAWPAGT